MASRSTAGSSTFPATSRRASSRRPAEEGRTEIYAEDADGAAPLPPDQHCLYGQHALRGQSRSLAHHAGSRPTSPRPPWWPRSNALAEATRDMTVRLRGMTWDHPRGFDPLAAEHRALHRGTPDIESRMEPAKPARFRRPADRGAGRASSTFMVIDHPFAAAPARPVACATCGRFFRRSSTPCWSAKASALRRGPIIMAGVWALPTDAACQVASYRADLLAELGFDAPPGLLTTCWHLAQPPERPANGSPSQLPDRCRVPCRDALRQSR